MGDAPAWEMGLTNNPHCKKNAVYRLFRRTSEMGETCSTNRSDKNCVQIFCCKIREEEIAGCLGWDKRNIKIDFNQCGVKCGLHSANIG